MVESGGRVLEAAASPLSTSYGAWGTALSTHPGGSPGRQQFLSILSF